MIMEKSEKESPAKRRRLEDSKVAVDSRSSDEPLSSKEARGSAQIQTSTVYIGGLHTRITEAHVEKLMQSHGTVRRISLLQSKGQPSLYAFCEFETIEQAAAAIAALDGRALLGKRLLVRPAHGSPSKTSNPLAPSQPKQEKSPEKERKRIESTIQAIKRKLQDTQDQSSDS